MILGTQSDIYILFYVFGYQLNEDRGRWCHLATSTVYLDLLLGAIYDYKRSTYLELDMSVRFLT